MVSRKAARLPWTRAAFLQDRLAFGRQTVNVALFELPQVSFALNMEGVAHAREFMCSMLRLFERIQLDPPSIQKSAHPSLLQAAKWSRRWPS